MCHKKRNDIFNIFALNLSFSKVDVELTLCKDIIILNLQLQAIATLIEKITYLYQQIEFKNY